MKILCILVLGFVAGCSVGAEPTWNPADAVKAEQDIRSGHITREKWRIEHGRLIETWRFSGESSNSTSKEEIQALGASAAKFLERTGSASSQFGGARPPGAPTRVGQPGDRSLPFI